jgi:formate-dependent nitrite reductase membrane component NrfD
MQKKVRQLPVIHLVLVILEISLIALLLTIAMGREGVTAQAVQALISGQNSLLFWALFAVPGLALPLATLALGWFGVHWRALDLVEGICIVLAGLLLRYLVLISGIPVTL